jgi:hypothetical protein
MKAKEQGKKLIAKQLPEAGKNGRPLIDLEDEDSDDDLTPAERDLKVTPIQ